MRLIWIVLAIMAALGAGLAGCAAIRLPAVELDPALAPSPPPPVLGALGEDPAVTNAADWEGRRAPLLRRYFAERVYGPMPADTAPAQVVARQEIAYPPLAGIARVEQLGVEVGRADARARFNMVLVTPAQAQAPVPVIVMQNFCGNRAALPQAPAEVVGPLTAVMWVCDSDWAGPIVQIPFGRHIFAPPYESILERGYGVAMFYAGDVVADDASSAPAGLAQLYGGDADRAGAVAAWAWLYGEAYDVLAADARVDAERIAIWGHSRNGKAALYAAAMDPRIAAVIAHQSGRGGASLTRSDQGESVAQMTDEFGWWFPSAFRAPPPDPGFDQHQLIALIAPRPVLLGNAARDAWSDPRAAWAAAEAAGPAYALYGASGMAQEGMRAPNMEARIAYFTRPGLHGVTPTDWAMFLDFLDMHLRRDAPPQTAATAARP